MEEPGPGGARDAVPTAQAWERALVHLEAAAGDLAALVSSLDGSGAPDAARLVATHTRLRRVTGRLDGVRYAVLPRIEDAGSWRSGGAARTFATWLRLREGVAASTARKDVSTARRLAQALPATRDRLVAGTLGADHARVMCEVAPTSRTRQDALAWLVDTRTGEVTTPEAYVQTVPVDVPDPSDDPDGERTRTRMTEALEAAVDDGVLVTGETLVLDEARTLDADRFRVVARRFATVTDPDADDADDDKAAEGEFLDLSRTFGGFHVAGFLTHEHGTLVTTAVNALLGAPSAEDTRTPGQRRAQALADVARLVLDTDQASPGAAVRPHLNVTVSWTELLAQAACTDEGRCAACGRGSGQGGSGQGGSGQGGGPGISLTRGGPVLTESRDRIPRSLLRRLACDSAITRIVFGPDGAVLDVGRAQRTVSGQMRRAVIARDRHCVYPGCDQPPSRCEVHHAVVHWADGGSTSAANSALLCWYHHQLVDTRGITMRWVGTSSTVNRQGAAATLLDSGWAFTDARGRRIRLPDPVDADPPGGTGGDPPGAAVVDVSDALDGRPAGAASTDGEAA
ncbi:DUF222 domain-containing protein [Promicromonospora citrea]|uniref:HNH endonuclease signature motif containing protein n=1 Tax=Promicromonospora citrea TaxID=43677 RepID=UPI001487E3F1|nr:HNH endonuclease signature motif containing protein [Promicromonospora citrea]NNH54673.1 DUF222 domain-containing protein [Promicromonospora citrea]